METTIASGRIVAERRFYSGMAIAILMSVFLGFARSFFLRPLFPDHASPAEPIFYIHGVAFTLWIIVFVAQVMLISRGRVALHKTIGLASLALAVAMIVLGISGAITAANRSSGFFGIPAPPLQFLAVPLFDMIMFPAFVALAFIKRNNGQHHKRWMVLATLNIITAAIARWPIIGSLGPLAFFGVTDLFIVALAIWDIRTRGKIHPVTLWGGLLTIISQPLRLLVSGTAAWMSFAEWATSMAK